MSSGRKDVGRMRPEGGDQGKMSESREGAKREIRKGVEKGGRGKELE